MGKISITINQDEQSFTAIYDGLCVIGMNITPEGSIDTVIHGNMPEEIAIKALEMSIEEINIKESLED